MSATTNMQYEMQTWHAQLGVCWARARWTPYSKTKPSNSDLPPPSTIMSADIQHINLSYTLIYGCKWIVWYHQAWKCSCCNFSAILPFPPASLCKKHMYLVPSICSHCFAEVTHTLTNANKLITDPQGHRPS
jgi:hypothetical protein